MPYAKKVAELIQSEHHELIVDSSSLDVVDELIQEYGEPFADSSSIPSYYVSKFASKYVKVVLGGDGGDEIFAGYNTYSQGYRMMQWRKLFFLKPIFKQLTNISKLKYLHGVLSNDFKVVGSALHRSMGFRANEINLLFKNKELGSLVNKENTKAIREAYDFSDNPFDALMYSNVRNRLPNDYLVKTDRASMFNSLELRTPFLDKTLIDFTSRLKYDKIMKQGQHKYILKKLAARHFGHDFAHRKKMGFGIPLGNWIRGEWRERVEEVVLSQNKLIDLNMEFVKKVFFDHVNMKANNDHKIWVLYVFNKWSDTIMSAKHAL